MQVGGAVRDSDGPCGVAGYDSGNMCDAGTWLVRRVGGASLPSISSHPPDESQGLGGTLKWCLEGFCRKEVWG